MRLIGVLAGAVLLSACGGREDPADAVRTVSYRCTESAGFDAVFNPRSGIVTLLGLAEVALLLPQRPAASGFLYGTERVEFRGRGTEAVLTIDGASNACTATTPAPGAG